MFIETVQYSLEFIRVTIKQIIDEQKVLPITEAKNTKKCLDFDMDKVVFQKLPNVKIKVQPIYPDKPTWLEVMDRV